MRKPVPYVWIDVDEWLHNPRRGRLSDAEWCIEFEQYIKENTRYENYRDSWSMVRKKMTAIVMGRDPHECRQCGSTKNLEIDHIIPMVKGGSNSLDNLQILCRRCNRRKYNK